jgi:hypothetical protein
MPEYYLEVPIHRYTVREIDPTDSWDAGETGINFDVTRIARSNNSLRGWDVEKVFLDYWNKWESDDIPIGSPAFVVVVYYSTGNTFGREEALDFPAVKATYEAAQEVVADIRLDKKGLMPWNGYFEYVIDISVVELEMEA